MQAVEALPRDLFAACVHGKSVDYAALEADLDQARLAEAIATFDPKGTETAACLAFYLNAYNALVLLEVLRRRRADPAWPGCVSLGDKLSFFFLRRHLVAGRRMSLYHLENRVIRRDFREPRIHFALNCASRSCPPLTPLLFTAETLETDLDRLTRAFLASDAVQADPEQGILRLSRIFKWYAADFMPSVTAFIGAYRALPFRARLTYQRYDWRLNAWEPGSGEEQTVVARGLVDREGD